MDPWGDRWVVQVQWVDQGLWADLVDQWADLVDPWVVLWVALLVRWAVQIIPAGHHSSVDVIRARISTSPTIGYTS